MATIKYRKSNGETVTVNQYKVNNILLVDELGNDPSVAISQRAASEGINQVSEKVDQLESNVSTLVQPQIEDLQGKIQAETQRATAAEAKLKPLAGEGISIVDSASGQTINVKVDETLLSVEDGNLTLADNIIFNCGTYD